MDTAHHGGKKKDTRTRDYTMVFVLQLILTALAIVISYQLDIDEAVRSVILIVLVIVQILLTAAYYMHLKYLSWWYLPLLIEGVLLGAGLITALYVPV